MMRVRRDAVGHGVFELGPDELVRVKLGSIAGEGIGMQARVAVQQPLDASGPVDLSPIPQQDHGPKDMAQEMPKEVGHLRGPDVLVGMEPCIQGQTPSLGGDVRAERAEILVHRPATGSQGVFPSGAQVRTTLGMSRNPLSSRKTRWAPSAAAFFYTGPHMPLPIGNLRFVALPGPLLGLLATPPQPHQESPHVIGVVPDPKTFSDHLRHTTLRP